MKRLLGARFRGLLLLGRGESGARRREKRTIRRERTNHRRASLRFFSRGRVKPKKFAIFPDETPSGVPANSPLIREWLRSRIGSVPVRKSSTHLRHPDAVVRAAGDEGRGIEETRSGSLHPFGHGDPGFVSFTSVTPKLPRRAPFSGTRTCSLARTTRASPDRPGR